MSSPSERIREARERLDLWPRAVADAAGLNDDGYLDVERSDSEVTSNISLRQLVIIANTLGHPPLEILEGAGIPAPAHRVSLAQLAELAEERMVEDGDSVDEFSERVGWEMAPVFADPEHIWTYPVDALQDICREAGVDWREALPRRINDAAGRGE